MGTTMWGCWSVRDTSTSPHSYLSPCLNHCCKYSQTVWSMCLINQHPPQISVTMFVSLVYVYIIAWKVYFRKKKFKKWRSLYCSFFQLEKKWRNAKIRKWSMTLPTTFLYVKHTDKKVRRTVPCFTPMQRKNFYRRYINWVYKMNYVFTEKISSKNFSFFFQNLKRHIFLFLKMNMIVTILFYVHVCNFSNFCKDFLYWHLFWIRNIITKF